MVKVESVCPPKERLNRVIVTVTKVMNKKRHYNFRPIDGVKDICDWQEMCRNAVTNGAIDSKRSTIYA